MWMFKSFSGKEQVGLEGRTIDIGKVKIQVSNAIAEGGFSCVYAAHDAMHTSKQYALKHMICNDEESLDLVMREIFVMSKLKGHPNVVTLVAHAMLDMGQRKEALLLMELCGKSLVAVLESRGDDYFDEKSILLIFQEVCSAVYAMHCQSPPIAHRDLKAENILLGADGAWKLCDFGSTSTNHKRFDKPEEMGIEEDNIRKYTTPAYRAPEMWDLFKREVINEKVDIWALGCLLYKICYFKFAFDGDSKLQILNGNYRIPKLPKYSASITNLIKDMLESSPNMRPDIMQVWSRVNKSLPMELQGHTPDSVGKVGLDPLSSHDEGFPNKTSLPREQVRNMSPHLDGGVHQSKAPQGAQKVTRAPIGAFWSTSHAKDSEVVNTRPCNAKPLKQSTSKHNHGTPHGNKDSPKKHGQSGLSSRCNERTPMSKLDANKPNQINFFQDVKATKTSSHENKPIFENKTLNAFAAEFGTQKFGSMKIGDNNGIKKSMRNELEAEVDALIYQLKQANLEKADITSKYEKLSIICHSQRQEIHELKNALTAAARSTPKETSRNQSQSANTIAPKDIQIEGTIWELEQGMITNSLSLVQEPQPWQAFESEPEVQPAQGNHHPTYIGTTNDTSTVGAYRDAQGNNLNGLRKTPNTSEISTTPSQGNTSQRFNGMSAYKVEANRPSGWAGF